MTIKNTPERWGAVSQSLHWLIVLLIAVMAAIGLTMEDFANGPDKIRIYALHKSLGITILALVALRLLWRLYAGAPKPVPGTRPRAADERGRLVLRTAAFAIALEMVRRVASRRRP